MSVIFPLPFFFLHCSLMSSLFSSVSRNNRVPLVPQSLPFVFCEARVIGRRLTHPISLTGSKPDRGCPFFVAGATGFVVVPQHPSGWEDSVFPLGQFPTLTQVASLFFSIFGGYFTFFLSDSSPGPLHGLFFLLVVVRLPRMRSFYYGGFSFCIFVRFFTFFTVACGPFVLLRSAVSRGIFSFV